MSQIAIRFLNECSFSTYHTEKGRANEPSSQHTISFLNKRNSDLLLTFSHGLELSAELNDHKYEH